MLRTRYFSVLFALTALIGFSLAITPVQAQNPSYEGERHPDLVVEDYVVKTAGAKDLADMRGKVVLVEFWSTT